MADRHDSADEFPPLLQRPLNPLPEPTAESSKPWILLVGVLTILIALTDMGATLVNAPKTRLYESVICLHYYERADPSKIQNNGIVREELCKINAVQDTVAMLFR